MVEVDGEDSEGRCVTRALHHVTQRMSVLGHVSFRRFLAGRGISVLGDGLFSVAVMWLVFDLTGSTVFTGIAGFLTESLSLFSAFVGPLVDNMDKKRVLVGGEVLSLIFVVLIPIGSIVDMLSIWVVLFSIPMISFSDLISGPAQNAIIPRVVPESDLVRANSLFSAGTKLCKATARGLAGILIAAMGTISLFVIDAATFALAAVLFSTVSTGETVDKSDSLTVEKYVQDLWEGIDLLRGTVAAKILIASLLANFLIGAIQAVLPKFASDLGGPELYGLFLAAITVGKIIGSGGATLVDDVPLGHTTILGLVTAATLWAGAVLVPGRIVTIGLFTLAWVPIAIYNVSLAATIQNGIADEFLGRVWALATSGISIVVSLEFLAGGALGEVVPSSTFMLSGGLGFVLMAGYWTLTPALRNLGAPIDIDSDHFT